jgi:hypothetical protein
VEGVALGFGGAGVGLGTGFARVTVIMSVLFDHCGLESRIAKAPDVHQSFISTVEDLHVRDQRLQGMSSR